MRTIKFRAWDKSKKEMFKLWNPYISQFLAWEIADVFVNWKNEKHNYIFLQYTWLNDKEWKEIYEGDILTSLYSFEWCKWNYLIEWDDRNACFDNKKIWEHQQNNVSVFMRNLERCQIIWNIYENPELIK